MLFTQSFVLWAGQQCLRLELFVGKFSFSLSSFFIYLSLSLAFPRFGLLSHVSSLRLPSGHSGLVLTLSNAAHTSLFSPHLLRWMWVSGLLLPWELQLGTYFVGSIYLFFLLVMLLWDSKTPHRPTGERVSWCLETSPLLRLRPQDGSLSLTLLSLFLSFIFCPTSFQREWLPFWVPGVLRQCSEVILWYLLSVQMIFQ